MRKKEIDFIEYLFSGEPKNIIDTINNIDFNLLREQRNHLLTLEQNDFISGIVNLLDQLIDYGIDTGKLILEEDEND